MPIEIEGDQKIDIADESQDILKNLEIKLDTEEVKRKIQIHMLSSFIKADMVSF